MPRTESSRIEGGAKRFLSYSTSATTTNRAAAPSSQWRFMVMVPIIDGEIVRLDDAGVPRFDWLLHRRHPPSFVAFDLVWLNGCDYRNKPLLERKRALRKIIPTNSPFVSFADFVIERGVGLFRAACARDLEGIIAERI